MKKYNFEWKTVEEIIANKNTMIYFKGYGEYTLQEIFDGFQPNTTDEDIKKAHELWLVLKDAFNKEADWYNEKLYNSPLGSVGSLKEREVCRSNWWNTLDGDSYGDYRTLTLIIEILHHGESLETGTILFGS